MSAPEPTPSPAYPVAPPAPESPRRRYGDARYGMSLVAVLLATYLFANGAFSQLGYALAAQQERLVYVVPQLLFVLALALFGVLVAPTSAARRGGAAAIVAGATVLTCLLVPAYQLGRLPIRPPLSVFVGGTWLVIVAMIAAWLLVRERSGIAYVFLIATVLIPLAGYGVAVANLPTDFSLAVQNVLLTVIGVGIAWAGWAVSRRHRPAHPQP